MVTMKIDLSGENIDPTKPTGFEPYLGGVPRPGVYAAEIKRMTIRISQAGNPYFNVLYVLSHQNKEEKEKYFGAPVWDKVTPGPSDFQKVRVAQLTYAITGNSKIKANVQHEEVTNGGLVTKFGSKDPVGTKVQLTLQRDFYNGEPTVKVGDVFPWPDDQPWPTGVPTAEAADDEEVEEVEEEDVEEEDVEEDEDLDDEEELDEEDEDDEDGDEYNARVKELDILSRTELKSIVKAALPDMKITKSMTDDDLRKAVLRAEFEVGDEDEDPF